jgi:hypothetical protein
MQGNKMKLTLNGFDEDQFRWCFWGAEDQDSIDSGTDPSSAAESTAQAESEGASSQGGGGGSDPSGMASFAAEASRVTGGQLDAAAANAAAAAMSAGLSGGDGSGYRGAYTLPTATGMVTMPAPVERRSPVSIDLPNYQPTNYGQADLDKALAQFGDARDAAYADKQFGADFGKFFDRFGIYAGIYDAIFDPEAAMANALAERGVRSFEDQDLPSRTVGGYSVSDIGNYSPTGLDIVTAGGPLSQGGRVAGYDEFGNIVYDTNSLMDSIGGLLTGQKTPANIQELYNRKNLVDEQRMAMNDGGDNQPLLVPEVAQTDPVTGEPIAFPKFTPREYKYQPFVGNFYSIPSRFTKPYGLLS